ERRRGDEPRADRALVARERVRERLELHAETVSLDEERARLLGQSRERVARARDLLAALGVLGRVGSRDGHAPNLRVGEPRLLAPDADRIERRVPRDPVEPGPEGALLLEAVEGLVEPEERLLERVLREGVVAEEPRQEREDLVLVAV